MGGGVKVQVGIRKRYTRTPLHRPGAVHIRNMTQSRIGDNSHLVGDLQNNEVDIQGDNLAEFGDEGYDISHAGGEYEVFSNVVEELVKVGIGQRGRRYDTRDRRNRTLKRIAAWAVQIESLTDAYLHWKNGEAPPRYPDDVEVSWEIPCIDLFHRKSLTVYQHQNSPRTNAALVLNGAIGCAPQAPSICLTLRTLEEYYQGHRFNPRMSIQAQVRKICAIHNVPFRNYLVTQFSIAFDVYLTILHQIDERVNRALSRTSPNWRARNSCPACEYKLENEPPLRFSKLIAIDGNNSLRRIDPTHTKLTSILEDSRQRTSDIWLTPVEVDEFKDQVKAQAQYGHRRNSSHIADDVESQELNTTEGDGDVTAGSPEVTVCIERWQAAAPDERKRMWKMFVETGVFIAVCRHGFLLFLCDMIQSGELAKYPLALLDRLIDVYGQDLAVGYDIGCAFSQTINKSPKLANKACQANVRMLVPSFHGHAHNRECQLHWHPMYIPGTGLEDFETCERVFSQSNALAAGIRHASTFHRIQAIEVYFKFWDEDKYTLLVQFISDNYHQALEIIENDKPLLAQYSKSMGYLNSTYEGFLDEERRYLDSLKRPRSVDLLDVEYVTLLQRFESAQSAYNQASQDWHSQDQILHRSPPSQHRHILAQLLHKLQATFQSQESLYSHVCKVEVQMGIAHDERWKPEHPHRMAVVEDLNHQAFNEALDNLERLVVMRLFELTKLNQSGTAYKMRRQIQKHLQTHSRAIRTALARYNKMAAQLIPPREQLDIAKVLDYAFIGEFELLRFSREDIRDCAWAQPRNREAMQRYFRIKAAEEEICRLNVEIRRIVTFIFDESKFITQKIAELSSSNPLLGHEIERRWTFRQAIHKSHLVALEKLSSRAGFTGTLQPGRRLINQDTTPQMMDHTPPPPPLADIEGLRDEADIQADAGEFSEDDEISNLVYDLENWHESIE